ncbi:MAG: tryptophan-rich sensory protein [Steroidobacteraceae bacterium]|nr:tryptophan-rich sensory protein [Steroidobacteraceae bacterium]
MNVSRTPTAPPSFWKPLAVAAGLALAIGAAGGLLTRLDAWYYALRVPPWKPPDLAFGPAWTTIFALCAVAAALAWRARPEAAFRRRLLLAFGVNAALNVLWSALFFFLRRPDWASSEVVLLWGSIVWVMVVLQNASRLAALLLLPYLAWVTLAAALTWEIARLNGPFG